MKKRNVLIALVAVAVISLPALGNDCCQWGTACASTSTGTGDQELCEDLGGVWNPGDVCRDTGQCDTKDAEEDAGTQCHSKETEPPDAGDSMCCAMTGTQCPSKVPALPVWGLIGLAALTSVGGAILVGRRRVSATRGA